MGLWEYFVTQTCSGRRVGAGVSGSRRGRLILLSDLLRIFWEGKLGGVGGKFTAEGV